MYIYLAGPDLFHHDAHSVISRKVDLARKYGFSTRVAMPSNRDSAETRYDAGLRIAGSTIDLMKQCDLIVANLTPFRGVSADVGTVFELGFMVALGKTAFAYSNDGRAFADRTISDYYRGSVLRGPDGRTRGADGIKIEENDMGDNLMLDGGVKLSGGTFIRRTINEDSPDQQLSVYEDCLKEARVKLLL